MKKKFIAKVVKWGNRLGVCLPKKLVDKAGIEEGMEVELALEDGSLTVKPISDRVTLEELMKKVTPENRHPEIDFGKPQGREIW